MAWRALIGRLVVLVAFSAGLLGCTQETPPAAPVTVSSDVVDLMHSKVEAYDTGVAAGRRIQARRDEEALAAATKPDCQAPPAPDPVAANPVAANPVLASPPAPVENETQVYTPGGPAVPVSPLQ